MYSGNVPGVVTGMIRRIRWYRAGEGGYYIFSETNSYSAGDRDFFLLKITKDGEEEWYETYSGPGREWPYGMLPLSNGDLLLYRFTETVGGGRDKFAIRVAQDGSIIWEYTVENPGEELVLDVLETYGRESRHRCECRGGWQTGEARSRRKDRLDTALRTPRLAVRLPDRRNR